MPDICKISPESLKRLASTKGELKNFELELRENKTCEDRRKLGQKILLGKIEIEVKDGEKIGDVLEKNGRIIWKNISKRKIKFSEMKNYFTGEQLSKTLKGNGSSIWGSIWRNILTLETLKIYLDKKKLGETLVKHGSYLWNSMRKGKIKFSEIKDFISPELLTKSLERGAIGLFKGVKEKKIKFSELKDYFTKEQLSKSLGEGGFSLWMAVAEGGVSFKELGAYFTKEDLGKTLGLGGESIWKSVSNGKIKFSEMKKYFTKEQLSKSLEDGGRELWGAVGDKKINFMDLKNYFKKDDFKLSLKKGGTSMLYVLLDKVVKLSEIKLYFTDPLDLVLLRGNVLREKLYLDVLDENPEDLDYLIQINPLLVTGNLEKKLSKDSAKKYKSGLVKSVKLKFKEDEKNNENNSGDKENKLSDKDKIDPNKAKIKKIDLTSQDYNELMRTINHLHDSSGSTNNEIRKAMVEVIPAKHLYKLLIHGKTELFTSTSTFVNYIFPKILKEIKKSGGLMEYLKKVDPEKKNLPVFMEVFARYGKIQDILSLLKSEDEIKNISKDLLDFKIENKDFNYDSPLTTLNILNYLHEDVEKNPKNREKNEKFINKIEEVLLENLSQSENLEDKRKNKIYKLISAMYLKINKKYLNKNIVEKLKNIKSKSFEKLSQFEKIKKSDLFTEEIINGEKVQVHRHLQFFIESSDRDGEKSRWSMDSELKREGFKIDRKLSKKLNKSKKGEKNKSGLDEIFVFYKEKIQGGKKYRTEVILSNVMKSSDPKMDTNLKKYLHQDGEENLGKKKKENSSNENKKLPKNIHSISYRGHSTYVEQASNLLKKLRDKSPKIFEKLVSAFWGSCGGTSSLKEFRKGLGMIPPSLATNATGTSDVTSPIVAKFFSKILKIKKELSWKKFNKEMDGEKRVSGNSKYSGYQFPQKNISAQFISAVQSIMKEG